jgi:hypothetical protein
VRPGLGADHKQAGRGDQQQKTRDPLIPSTRLLSAADIAGFEMPATTMMSIGTQCQRNRRTRDASRMILGREPRLPASATSIVIPRMQIRF